MSLITVSRTPNPYLRSWVTLALISSGLTLSSADAAIPREIEPDYARAVLAFHDKDYAQTVSILTSIDTQGKKIREILEMQGLALKLDKKTDQAIGVYQELAQTLIAEGAPAQVRGPVEFEIGMLLVSLKRMSESVPHFEAALEAKTNPGTSALYVGLASLSAANWEKAANAFKLVGTSTRTELHPAGAFYLGQSYSQMGFPAGAIDAFQKSVKVSESLEKSPLSTPAILKLASEMKASASAALKPYDDAKVFANLSVLAGYDSNLLAVPNSIASDPSGKASAQTVLLGGAGYMSSPMNELQYVPSYRFFYNNNFSSEADLTEFLNQSGSFSINRNALGVFSQGIRFDGNWTFRNDSETLANYSTRGSMTVSASYFVSPGVRVGIEAFGGLQSFPSDPEEDDLKRSGSLWGAKLTGRRVRGTRWVNPALDLGYSQENTSGTEYRSQTLSLGTSNRIIWNNSIDITPSIDLAWVRFTERIQGERSDLLLSAQVNAQWRFGKNWAALMTLGFAKNTSNLDESFSYQRTTGNAGISYSY